MTAEARLRLALALGAVLIAVLAFGAVRGARLSSAATASLERTQDLSIALVELLADANRMQRANRELMLFNRQDRAPVEAAKTSFFDHYVKAAALAERKPEQLARLRAVRQSFELAVAQEEHLLAERLPKPDFLAMDRLRDGIAEMLREEQQDAHRLSAAARARARLELLLLAFIAAALTGCIFLLYWR
ncbi:MAG TPA: hypothetical protein VH083_02745, partial [Myxococcales bacterium]|nr:hypothetical protein [Myxococcales bacterium]